MKYYTEETQPYCTQCGEDEDLAFGNTYSSGTEITCRVCENVFQRILEEED